MGDGQVGAFVEIGPIGHGHVVVGAGEGVEFRHPLEDGHAGARGAALPKVGRAMVAATGATAYNLLQNNGALANQAVPHVHMHLIPRFEDGRGLGIGWPSGQVDHGQAAAPGAPLRDLLARQPPS